MDGEASDLSTRLRVDTQALHLQAERSGYLQEILKRRASQTGYTLFLRNLLPAYQAMERALNDHAALPEFQSFDWPPLFRSEAIIGDLRALSGTETFEKTPLLAEGLSYAERIQSVATDEPTRLIGHAYVRYIGDLSGGQIVKKLLSASPGLPEDMLGFYEFPGIADAEDYKHGFRASLDQVGAIRGDADAIVDEAKRAFSLNIDLSMGLLKSLSD